MIPNVSVSDQGQNSSGYLRVKIEGNPEAIFFKDRKYGNFTADICGNCGHVQLRIGNAAELYQHYLNAR